jgi:hypothetical protein
MCWLELGRASIFARFFSKLNELAHSINKPDQAELSPTELALHPALGGEQTTGVNVGEEGLRKPRPRPARLTVSARARFRSRGETFAPWV